MALLRRRLFFLHLVLSRGVLHARLRVGIPGGDPVGSGLFGCRQRPARRSAYAAQRIDESRQPSHAKTVSNVCRATSSNAVVGRGFPKAENVSPRASPYALWGLGP